MKLRIIQENNIVIITILSFSDKFISKFKKRTGIQLIKEYHSIYLGIYLKSKKSLNTFNICDGELRLHINSKGDSKSFIFSNKKEAIEYIDKLKKSIALINHGTESNLITVNSVIEDTKVEILE